MSWPSHAESIWGDRWVAPMARALGVNPRTVQRWKESAHTLGERNACPDRVQRALHNAALEIREAKR